jgi:hypothetical protein
MEFYVVDPKDLDFNEWSDRVRAFLDEEQCPYTVEDGGLYYIGDDVAAPWHEDSLLFKVDGDEGGMIELRDGDRNFYVFTDDLSGFDDREIKESMGFQSRTPLTLYGFRMGNQKGCRFHLGPSTGLSFFVDDDDADYPPILPLSDVWKLFFRSVRWLQQNISRIQDALPFRVEKMCMDFEVDLQFAHPASLDVLNEILSDEDGFERSRGALRATFRDRDLTFLMRFIAELPPDPEDFDEAQIRVVWRGTVDGAEREVFFTGVERRHLRPFVQLPFHRTSKSLLDKLRNHFKGHRVDRQEYNLDG